jgi:hypothetical protein
MTTKHNIGDQISVLVHKDKTGELHLINPIEKEIFEPDVTKHTFEAIGKHQRSGELVLATDTDFDPHRYLTFRVYSYFNYAYDVDQRWTNKKAILVSQDYVYVPEDLIAPVVQIHMNTPGGSRCNVCSKWIDWACANLPNGGFACRKCRTLNKWELDRYLKDRGIDPDTVKF